MPDIPFPRGVRDLLPNEALFRNELLKRIENVFQMYGFLTIDTPTFESIDVLKAKNGIGSDTKLIYELKDEKLGLRYDHTVSLARYIAMHADLPLPFKRYYIGKTWRREEPQRNRFREITQADCDIIGGNKIMADAEVLALGSIILEGTGIEYVVCINDRNLMDNVLAKFGVKPEQLVDVMRALDKLDKIGSDGVAETLKGLSLENAVTDQIMAFINLQGTNEEKLEYVDNLLGNGDSTKDIRSVLTLLSYYKLRGDVRIEFSIIRGLDYYSGIIFEYKNKEDMAVSIGGGGRYDNLIEAYSSKSMPAVGMSIGIDRILEMLNFSASIEYTYANVFIANVNEGNYPYALKVATMLRANGIPTDVNIASRNLSNQLAYANSIKTKYALVVGDAEEKVGKVKIRNLVTGNESTVFIDEAIKIIKGE
jgi:histidyl-tRNA synthetase